MSNIPGKKKSCFEITSVTQAQVARNTITDSESIEDPDESQTVDVSRTELGVTSEELLLNHTGDYHIGPASGNGAFLHKSSVTEGRNTPVSFGGSVLVSSTTNTQTSSNQPPCASNSGAPISCSSRFRVIKLDHGIGEPFRKGKWTCTEFYEKESESNRTIDSLKPTVTHEHSSDRDSGVGFISNSVNALNSFTAPSVDNAEGTHPTVSFPSSELLQQGYTIAPPTANIASAFQPTGYETTKTTPVIVQPVNSNGLNDLHQAPVPQKSPVMPRATQPQQLTNSNVGILSGLFDHQHIVSSSPSFRETSQRSHSNQPLSPLSPPSSGATKASLASVMTTSSQALEAISIAASSPIPFPRHNGIWNVPAMVNASRVIPSHSGVQSEDSRSDSLPLSISVRPLITEGLSLSAPTVSLFGIAIPVAQDDDSVSGVGVVAIDNKIEQAMDLVKNHLMYAVREEVEVLKEQIKELYERNSVLERENAVLKSLANSEQLNKVSNQLTQVNSISLQQLPQHSNNGAPHQPKITSA
ncbi:unnamed protein product [Knipowitschia caucasica]